MKKKHYTYSLQYYTCESYLTKIGVGKSKEEKKINLEAEHTARGKKEQVRATG